MATFRRIQTFLRKRRKLTIVSVVLSVLICWIIMISVGAYSITVLEFSTRQSKVTTLYTRNVAYGHAQTQSGLAVNPYVQESGAGEATASNYYENDSSYIESSSIYDISSYEPSSSTSTTQDPVRQYRRVRRSGITESTYSDLLASIEPVIDMHEKPISNWLSLNKTFCEGRFVGYAHRFAKLRDVTVDPGRCVKSIKGGEDMSLFLSDKKKTNLTNFMILPGFFGIECGGNLPKYDFISNKSEQLSNYMKTLGVDTRYQRGFGLIRNFTIAVQRNEYANLYHSMTDFYNAFLVMHVFRQNPVNTTVLLVDTHPWGTLDEVWSTLFGKLLRVGHLETPIHFRDLVWSIIGYESPMENHKGKHSPYMEEFRKFFLSRYQIKDNRVLNCFKLSILFIWRRDYVAHPWNPSGRIQRKIHNEAELLRTARQTFPHFDIKGVQLDKMPMSEQLQLIANTDILIGMHGAGLSHTLFLPKHAGLIEFFPRYTTQKHFAAMAKWRKLRYIHWKNIRKSRELSDGSTVVLAVKLHQILKDMFMKICR